MMLLLVLVLLVAVHYLSREYSRYAHHIVQARNDFRCDNVKMWKTLFFSLLLLATCVNIYVFLQFSWKISISYGLTLYFYFPTIKEYQNSFMHAVFHIFFFVYEQHSKDLLSQELLVFIFNFLWAWAQIVFWCVCFSFSFSHPFLINFAVLVFIVMAKLLLCIHQWRVETPKRSPLEAFEYMRLLLS